MSDPQAVLDEHAADVPYRDLADAFLTFDRPPGKDPVLLVVEAAASTTGQSYADGIQPTVERFRETFIEPGTVETLDDVAALDPDDETLVETVGAERRRHVLGEIASVISSRPESGGLAALQAWSAEANHYRYREDPIGSISGVGPATFQYLRMLAGTDTAKPDPQLEALVDACAEELSLEAMAGATGLRVIAAAEWLSYVTTYRMLEIDRIAWWLHTDPDAREAASSVD